MSNKNNTSLQSSQLETSLLQTSVELKRIITEDHICYFELVIGTDPETRFSISDTNLEALLQDLPRILSTVIQSQVLIESA